MGDGKTGRGQRSAVVQAAAGEHRTNTRGGDRQVGQVATPTGDGIAVALRIGVGHFVHRIQQQDQPSATQQFGERWQMPVGVAQRPFLFQPFLRRGQGQAFTRGPVAVQRQEQAQARFAGLAQSLNGQVKFQAAQQGAFAATGRTQQNQRRFADFGQQLAQVVVTLLRLPAHTLRLRPLVHQQGQPGETAVKFVARLRPLGDAGQPIVLQMTGRVCLDRLDGLFVQFGQGGIGEDCRAEGG